MSAINWLMAANIAVWLGFGGYIAFLGLKERGLEKRLRQMEIIQDGD